MRNCEEEQIKCLPPFSGIHLYDLVSLCLFCDKHFHLHTETESSRHGILHWVDAGISFTLRKSRSAVPIGLHHVNHANTEGENTQVKCSEKHAHEQKKDIVESCERRKVCPKLNGEEFNLWRVSSSFIHFPALSDNQCHFSM